MDHADVDPQSRGHCVAVFDGTDLVDTVQHPVLHPGCLQPRDIVSITCEIIELRLDAGRGCRNLDLRAITLLGRATDAELPSRVRKQFGKMKMSFEDHT